MTLLLLILTNSILFIHFIDGTIVGNLIVQKTQNHLKAGG
jgi:hypothetical protein